MREHRDTVLIAGQVDQKLSIMLEKLGYSVAVANDTNPLSSILTQGLFDLIVVDARIEEHALELCDFLRRDSSTRTVPIVYLAKQEQDLDQVKQRALSALEVVEPDCTSGVIVSRIATQLRLRKQSGADERSASLGEILAAQRDLNARFAKELHDARNIHQNLLPRELPSDRVFQLAVAYEPLQEVGGDWYYAQRERELLSLQIADVAGHGLPAAFLAAMTRLAFSAAPQGSAGERLALINKLLAPLLPEGRFVTMMSALFDPVSGALRLARAGTPPAFIRRHRDATVEVIAPQGFALGMFEDAEYQEISTTLEPGDVLAMVTDGVTEAKNRNSALFGCGGFEASLGRVNSNAPAGAIAQAVLDELYAFTEGRIIKDDLTLLLLKRTLAE